MQSERRPRKRKPSGFFSADLSVHSLVDLLQLLESSGRSGIATIGTTDDEKGTIHLRRGKVIWATAPLVHPFGKLVLDTLGPTTRATEQVIARRAAETQTRHAITQMIQWTVGSFVFQPEPHEAMAPRDIPPLELDIQSLLMDAVLAQAESAIS